jgi:hypothetical protein
MPGVAETFKSVIDAMTHGTDFKLVNLLQTANANLTYENLNTSIDKAENKWNILGVSYDTLHLKRNKQETANSPTVHGVLGS